MDIRFVSPLTAEDENRIASALFAALTTVLDNLAIPYTLQIRASGGEVYQDSRHASPDGWDTVRGPYARAAPGARVLTDSGDTERRGAMAGRAGRY